MNPYVSILDDILAHAKQMPEQCVGPEGECAYRGPHGNRCFIGALIPDDLYQPQIEGADARQLLTGPRTGAFADVFFSYLCGKYGPMDKKDLIEMLLQAQEIHDIEILEDEWIPKLEKLRLRYL